jgi:hypothetical protein
MYDEIPLTPLIKEKMVRESKEKFAADVAQIKVEVLPEQSYPWLKSGRVVSTYVASNRDSRLYYWVNAQSDCLKLNDTDNYTSLSKMLTSGGGDLPKCVPMHQLASSISKIIGSPERNLGDEQLLALAKTNWDLFLKRNTPDERMLFTKHCKEPVLSGNDGAWKLQFSSFPANGAVESWEVQGSPKEIVEIVRTNVVEPKTFDWPYG